MENWLSINFRNSCNLRTCLRSGKGLANCFIAPFPLVFFRSFFHLQPEHSWPQIQRHHQESRHDQRGSAPTSFFAIRPVKDGRLHEQHQQCSRHCQVKQVQKDLEGAKDSFAVAHFFSRRTSKKASALSKNFFDGKPQLSFSHEMKAGLTRKRQPFFSCFFSPPFVARCLVGGRGPLRIGTYHQEFVQLCHVFARGERAAINHSSVPTHNLQQPLPHFSGTP